MSTPIQTNDASNHKPLALVFLVTFAVLSLISIWLIYTQFAQEFTRMGQCTILSAPTTQEEVDTDEPTPDNAIYSVTFKVSLLTASGQRVPVNAFYSSANYTMSDANSAQALIKRYPVGQTFACGYTYLPFSIEQALFSPTIPLEGYLFPGFFLAISLVFLIISIVALRRPSAEMIPFTAEELAAMDRYTEQKRSTTA